MNNNGKLRSEKALSTLLSNSESGVCSSVNKCLILKLPYDNNIIVAATVVVTTHM